MGTANCQSAGAQQAASALNVAGVTLGMTVDQAKAALQKYSPAIKITTLYGVLNQGDVEDTARIWQRPSLPPASLKVPIGLVGISLSHAYDNGAHHEVSVDGKDPVTDVSGEWFLLRFTPNDNGGSLYAVARMVRYVVDEVDTRSLPDAAAFREKVLATYGEPSATSPDTWSYDWMYDLHGRMLSETSRDYARCQAGTVGPWSGEAKMPFEYRGPGGYSRFTGHDFALALSDVDGRSLDPDTQARIDDAFTQLRSLAPDISDGNAGVAPSRPRFRQCGIDFQVNLDPFDHTYLGDFTVFLADLNRAYFDDGVKAYLTSQAPAAPAAPTPKL
jgi:hypothetical protein